MPTLPTRPDLDQLRRQAKELLRAAWTKLKTDVRAHTSDRAEQIESFVLARVRDWTGRAARMLLVTPKIAEYGLAPAVVLGDVARVRAATERDPRLVNRSDPRSGWTPLHLVCASRWHRLDPARAGDLVAVARVLLDAGADPSAQAGGGWTPLRCAVAGVVAHPGIVRLLLERGAVPDDHDLCLACFGDDAHASLRLLLDVAPGVAESTALSAPISTGDIEGVRLLLLAGADPNRLPLAELCGAQYAADTPWPAAYAAIRSGCSVELTHLLLEHRADPNAPGPDGRSPYQLALRRGAVEVAAMLRRYGARPDARDVDVFLAACYRQSGELPRISSIAASSTWTSSPTPTKQPSTTPPRRGRPRPCG